jgi:hypothetical protein
MIFADKGFFQPSTVWAEERMAWEIFSGVG